MKIAKLLLVTLFCISGGLSVQASELGTPNGMLASEIDYWLVAHLNEIDDEGRRLVWDGTIEGAISGEIKWWFVDPSPATGGTHNGGSIGFYQAHWEILQEGEVVLAGDSAGKTVFPEGEDGVWDGHGVVTEAKGKYSPLKGRKIYESGPVLLLLEPVPTLEGTGLFTIY